MKHSIKSIVVSVGFLAATASTVLAQPTTAYTDNFASDTSLSSAYLNINNVNAGGSPDAWTFTPNSQLQLNSSSSGKANDLVGAFSAVTLSSAGEYVQFQATFSSPNLAGGTGSGPALLMALAYSGGTALGGGANSESEGATTGGGSTQNYLSMLGDIDLNNTPKTSTKFYQKPANNINGLAYYSDTGTAATPPSTQEIAEGSGTEVNLANSTTYTLTYKITYLSATEDQIDADITGGSLTGTQDQFEFDTLVGNPPLTEVFDTFDIGFYNGGYAAGMNLDLTDLEIDTTGSIAPSPEPSVLALGAAGVGLLGLIRRRRS